MNQVDRVVSSPESLASLQAAIQKGLEMFTPPPDLKVSEWADRYAFLPREGSAEPGRWVTARAEYQREMMDVINEPGIETVIYQIASQCGKTAVELNVMGYFAHQDPSPILFVWPSEELAEDVSKERIATMIRDTPVLRPLFGTPRTRDSGNTLRKKKFPGGFLALVGSNAPRGLAGRPVRIVLADEIDGYPKSAGSEGDPITLVEARTRNFWNRKRIYSSTPTVKGHSRIETLEQGSDRRRYFVPCPQCNKYQVLLWERLKWDSPKTGAPKHLPQTCYYTCVNGCVITEGDKPDMLRQGQWRKTNPGGGDGKTAGFQLSALYSPWFSWADIIHLWIKSYKDPRLRQVFINTVLGETYEIQGESADDSALMKRRIVYDSQVPKGAMILTAGLDVQADRVEMEVVGWGEGEESWSIEYKIFRGNPALKEFWKDVDQALQKTYLHESGALLRIVSAFIDSGGHHTKQVYQFCRPRQVRRVYACKGQGGAGVPLTKPRAQKRTHAMRVDLRMVGVDTAKETLYARLKLTDTGEGFCHFPSGYRDSTGKVIELLEYDSEYFAQLTAEKLVKEINDKNVEVLAWRKKRERNEALDCRVYAMAALDDLKPNWPAIAKNFEIRAEQPNTQQNRPNQPKVTAKPGWVNSWK